MASRDDASQASDAAPGEKAFKYKVILIGNSEVGKTSLVLRFVQKRFCDHHPHTIGATFFTQTVIVDDTPVKLDIWDTAGQEQFHSLIPMYYRGAQAAIVMYDITNMETFLATKSWVQELRRYASPTVVVSLAGNKADLHDQREVDFADAQMYADGNGSIFMETSAKTDMNVDNIFLAIAKELFKNHPGTKHNEDSQKLNVSGDKKPQHGGGSCCKK